MQIGQTRRNFLASASSAAAAGVLGARSTLAEDGPPETTTIRLAFTTAICFAPFDKPKYACAVVIEHGGGSGAAYPIARDVMTYIFAPDKAMAVLEEFEKQWGGNVQQRMATRYNAFAA